MASAEHEADDVVIRDATREDMPHICKLIYELAAYEGVPNAPQLSAEDLIADGFDSRPAWFFALVAVRGAAEGGAGGEVVGYVLANRAYSSWTRRAMYLEDVYVTPAMRRARLGRRLLAALAARAAADRVERIDWHVLESNEAARSFYNKLGARDLRLSEGRTAMRLDREHILRLAADHRH